MGAPPAPVLADEVSHLARAATSAAQRASQDAASTPGSCAETARAVDALKQLRSMSITPAILVQTQVGKPIRKLAKSANTAIATAAKVRFVFGASRALNCVSNIGLLFFFGGGGGGGGNWCYNQWHLWVWFRGRGMCRTW